MRGFRRILFWAVGLGLGVLLLGTWAVWVHGLWYEDGLSGHGCGLAFHLASGGGRVVLGVARDAGLYDWGMASRWQGFWWQCPPYTPSTGWSWGAFGYDVDPYLFTKHFVWAPAWLAPTVMTALSAGWGVRWWRRRGARGEQVCRRCGYDLRASKGRCPECGAEIGQRRGEGECTGIQENAAQPPTG